MKERRRDEPPPVSSCDSVDEVPVQGRHRVEVRDDRGALDTAVVELSYRSLPILPPVGKRKRFPALAAV